MSRKKHAEEFKISAVKMYEKGEQTAPEIARNLGIAVSLLYKWIKMYGSVDSKVKNQELAAENKRLRSEIGELKKELAITREHREILKKAAAYFAVQTL